MAVRIAKRFRLRARASITARPFRSSFRRLTASGMTEGWAELGDAATRIRVDVDRADGAASGSSDSSAQRRQPFLPVDPLGARTRRDPQARALPAGPQTVSFFAKPGRGVSRLLTTFCKLRSPVFEGCMSMAQRAAKIFLPSNDERRRRRVRATALRDFTQPWLDLNDKAVLVTGGTGSFGKHFVQTVIERYQPAPPRHLLARRAQAVRDAAALPDGALSLHALLHRRRARPRPPRARHARHRLCDPCRRPEAGADRRIQSLRMHPHQRLRRRERRLRGAAPQRAQGDRAVDRQGRQSGQSLRRLQARLRQDLRRRQQSRRRRRHAIRRRALRQCVRLARQRRALLQEAGGRRRARRCRSPIRA